MTAVIAASGPSMCVEDAEIIAHAQRGGRCNTIVVNNTWTLLPGASVLYAADAAWWDAYIGAVSSTFTGELWTQDAGKLRNEAWSDAARNLGLHIVKSKPGAGIHAEPDTVYQGNNSGHQAICLARLFGARKIILVGFDMQRTGGAYHFHGPHQTLANGNPTSFVKHFDTLAPQLAGEGCLVINASRQTALQCFLRADLAETLR